MKDYSIPPYEYPWMYIEIYWLLECRSHVTWFYSLFNVSIFILAILGSFTFSVIRLSSIQSALHFPSCQTVKELIDKKLSAFCLRNYMTLQANGAPYMYVSLPTRSPNPANPPGNWCSFNIFCIYGNLAQTKSHKYGKSNFLLSIADGKNALTQMKRPY